ncbi:MAG: hypothetical protein FWC32_01950 [Firmicutes bacterium]|nr:hypothetical protein [Bacillota bacterium]
MAKNIIKFLIVTALSFALLLGSVGAAGNCEELSCRYEETICPYDIGKCGGD